MSSIDYSGELGDTYMRLRREYDKGGKQPHWRYAANRDEHLRAQEVNRKVRASVFGWERPGVAAARTEGGAAKCAHCGGRLTRRTARLWRQVWAEPYGRRLDYWIHAGGCPTRRTSSATPTTNKSAAQEER